MELEGKLAVVTGVSRGIGLASVEALLAEGVLVVGWGRTSPELTHKDFTFVSCDITEEASVKKAFEETEKIGDISILINNAGLGYSYLIEETPTEKWKLMFDTNVHGLFHCSRLVIPGMKEREEGHIINVASIAATTGIETMSGYCATKFAVRGMSQSMYKELRPYGIKVTCVMPGSVKTNFFDDIESVTANDNMMMPADVASTFIHVLKTPPNYHHTEIEVRPLQPKGKRK